MVWLQVCCAILRACLQTSHALSGAQDHAAVTAAARQAHTQAPMLQNTQVVSVSTRVAAFHCSFLCFLKHLFFSLFLLIDLQVSKHIFVSSYFFLLLAAIEAINPVSV